MKKFILLIITALFLFSCNPFMNPDLRRKNRCNRKLERVIRKCPELIKTDTLKVYLDTTIITEKVRVDTAFSLSFDTVEIIKDKFHLKLVKSYDTLIVDGGCNPDTVQVNTFVKVPYETIKKIQLTPTEMIMNLLSKFWSWLIVLALIILILIFIKKIFFN